MKPTDILIIILVGILISGLFYMSFIFPKKVEKEEKQKEKDDLK